jgi:hypothetical protein
VGKLHNVVKYIRTTPQRREEFEDIVRGELQRQKDRIARTALPDEEAEFVSKEPLAVIQDNETRWNSVFCMIKRAFILKDPLDLFIKRALEKPTKDCPLPRDDELSAQDWNTLAATQDLLQPFFDLTMRLQGHATHGTHGALTEALPALEFLLCQLEAKRDEYSVAKELQHASATSRSGESVKKGGRKGKRPAEPEVPASDDIIESQHVLTVAGQNSENIIVTCSNHQYTPQQSCSIPSINGNFSPRIGKTTPTGLKKPRKTSTIFGSPCIKTMTMQGSVLRPPAWILQVVCSVQIGKVNPPSSTSGFQENGIVEAVPAPLFPTNIRAIWKQIF